MKTARLCPKCNGSKIYVVSPVQQTYCDAQATLRPFDITGAYVPTGKKTVLGGQQKKLQTAGPLDARVCAACGFVEWYLPEAALRMLARMIGTAVRVEEATPQPGR